MESNPTFLLIIVDIVFIANDFASFQPIHLLLQTHYPKNVILFFPSFFEIIDWLITFIKFNLIAGRRKKPNLSHDCLMASDYVELCFVFYAPFVESYLLDLHHEFVYLCHRIRSACDPSLDVFGVQMGHKHRYPISLTSHLKRFSEHLHCFYFALLLNFTYLYLVSGLHFSTCYSSSQNCAFSFYFKAMVNQHWKFPFKFSGWNFEFL